MSCSELIGRRGWCPKQRVFAQWGEAQAICLCSNFTFWHNLIEWSLSFSIMNGHPSLAVESEMKMVDPSIWISARIRRMLSGSPGARRRKWTEPISSMLMGADLKIDGFKSILQGYWYQTYHWAFKPGKAKVRSFSCPVLMDCNEQRAPEMMEECCLGATPCSRNDIVSERLFLIRKRGARVTTFVNLYLPSPSLQDKPVCISSDFCCWEATIIVVSAAGASKLNVCWSWSSLNITVPWKHSYLRPRGFSNFERKLMAILLWVW